MSTDTHAVEQRLAELRAELATLPAAIEQAERELAAADAVLGDRQQVFDAAGADYATAVQRAEGAEHGTY